jgi:hypothetical protein
VFIDTLEKTAKGAQETSPSTERLYRRMSERNGGGYVEEGWDMGVDRCLCWRERRVWDNLQRVTSGVSDCHQLAKKGDRNYRSCNGFQLEIYPIQKSKSNTYAGVNSHVVWDNK